MPKPLPSIARSTPAVALLALAGSALGLAGCASSPALADATAFEAQGVHVRHVRIRLAPYHTQDFEVLLARCIQSALSAELPPEYSWLCYREPPGRYWLICFSESEDGFAFPDAPDPLVGFARCVARAEGAEALAEVDRRLAELDYDVEWNVVHRQKAEWSTVNEMSTATHPKARMMVRTIKPGREASFDRALTSRTAFLRDHGYTLPIEGFVTLAGAPGTALQVVFPVDWPSYYSTMSFGAFVRGLDAREQDAYADRKRALMVTMDRAEFYEGDAARELSYGPDE